MKLCLHPAFFYIFLGMLRDLLGSQTVQLILQRADLGEVILVLCFSSNQIGDKTILSRFTKRGKFLFLFLQPVVV